MTLAVIPARWNSSRFPGKPVTPIFGEPMIVRVYRQVQKAELVDQVIVATDDHRIAQVCTDHNLEYTMTPKGCRTGTDRVAEVAHEIPSDIYVNVQGDSPLISPKDIDEIIIRQRYNMTQGIEVTNAYTIHQEGYEAVFLVKSEADRNRVLWLSRSPIPFFKTVSVVRYAHLGLYAFTPAVLLTFSYWKQTALELIESIEMLRYLEHSVPIGCFEAVSNPTSVDYFEDVLQVERIMEDEKANSG